ncbi:Predicted Na+-dependent transporter [Corynebacterium kutscheri]|uniref:Predicted Na+-dependent transporter n=1 Tax=Corynebacterium kutscheri TaxID=35755 RepID=A0A0F6R3F1_9CORY|nr:bile acid:sodium symporter family protein [Corynebacterium kutscheri]AKE42273.1 putative Na+-dependent transporter [Corynebacterium kutscheri]VEH05632.1 Predicted Na+-dependent transporter [Corynebacterium kutscheri]VEH10617.1 Predicted Na+-dependent transporter [Corynebacterium kutscheri]VEH81526.1 Predicted Na+-dependent transporter [Corynebacterium kutscheri]
MLTRLKKVDVLIVLIILAVIVAIIAPAQGEFAQWFSLATKVAIAVLFFLYGARLSTNEALDGLKNWKLHLTILCFTFVLFPIIGLILQPLGHVIGESMYLGILYLTLVPSTVQSSVAFTSIARGNVAGAIVSASISNLLGVVLTPLLVMALMSNVSEAHINVDGKVFADIAIQLLLPFILGQLCRRWVADFAAKKGTKIVDRGSITMVVYSAFSAGIVAGIWSQINVQQIVFLTLLSIALVCLMLWLTNLISRLLRFSRADRIAIAFCGSKKSLATGLPMASVIFASTEVGLLILPLMIFHQVQLMICSWLATRYSKQDPTEELSQGVSL